MGWAWPRRGVRVLRVHRKSLRAGPVDPRGERVPAGKPCSGGSEGGAALLSRPSCTADGAIPPTSSAVTPPLPIIPPVLSVTTSHDLGMAACARRPTVGHEVEVEVDLRHLSPRTLYTLYSTLPWSFSGKVSTYRLSSHAWRLRLSRFPCRSTDHNLVL